MPHTPKCIDRPFSQGPSSWAIANHRPTSRVTWHRKSPSAGSNAFLAWLIDSKGAETPNVCMPTCYRCQLWQQLCPTVGCQRRLHILCRVTASHNSPPRNMQHSANSGVVHASPVTGASSATNLLHVGVPVPLARTLPSNRKPTHSPLPEALLASCSCSLNQPAHSPCLRAFAFHLHVSKRSLR